METDEPQQTGQYERLAERARNDADFFHALVYDPERAIREMPELDREVMARILAIDPDTFVGRMVGLLRAGCGITCGDDSCERTCGMRSCGVTCASSCTGSTCGGRSCGQTTFVIQG
jgi:hypothetical protein